MMATRTVLPHDKEALATKPQHYGSTMGSHAPSSSSSERNRDEPHNDIGNSDASSETEENSELLQYLEHTANDVAQQIGGEMKRVSFREFVFLVRATLSTSTTSPQDRTQSVLLLLQKDLAQPQRWKSVLRTIYTSSLDQIQLRKDPPGLFYKTTLKKLQEQLQLQQLPRNLSISHHSLERFPSSISRPRYLTSETSCPTDSSWYSMSSGQVSSLSTSSFSSTSSLSTTMMEEKTRTDSRRGSSCNYEIPNHNKAGGTNHPFPRRGAGTATTVVSVLSEEKLQLSSHFISEDNVDEEHHDYDVTTKKILSDEHYTLALADAEDAAVGNPPKSTDNTRSHSRSRSRSRNLVAATIPAAPTRMKVRANGEGDRIDLPKNSVITQRRSRSSSRSRNLFRTKVRANCQGDQVELPKNSDITQSRSRSLSRSRNLFRTKVRANCQDDRVELPKNSDITQSGSRSLSRSRNLFAATIPASPTETKVRANCQGDRVELPKNSDITQRRSHNRNRNLFAATLPASPTQKEVRVNGQGNRVELPKNFEVFAVNSRKAVGEKSHSVTTVTTAASCSAHTAQTDTNQLSNCHPKESQSGKGRGGFLMVRRLLGRRSTSTHLKKRMEE
eukprot:jgi/Psemu1/36290/gm1.36290_g